MKQERGTGVQRVIRVGLSAWFVSLGMSATSVSAGQSESERSSTAAVSSQRTLLDQYCVTCHNREFVEGANESGSMLVSQLRAVGLALDDVNVDQVAEAPEVWEAVVRKLRVGAMPPQPRPLLFCG